MPETLAPQLKILSVTATPGQTGGLNRVTGGAVSCHTEGKDRETSSTSSFKSFVNVVNWANHRRFSVQVLETVVIGMTQTPRWKVGNQREPCLHE